MMNICKTFSTGCKIGHQALFMPNCVAQDECVTDALGEISYRTGASGITMIAPVNSLILFK